MKPLVLLVLAGAVLLTQRWYGWEAGHEFGGGDAASYEEIAMAAPGMPAETLPFHHAQRLAGPWLVGVFARTSGLEPRSVFAAATGACLLLALAFVGATLRRLGLANRPFALFAGFFALHFSLRFYLVAPGMLPDALFVAGLALVLWGLAYPSLGLVLTGILVAALGRQTALLVLPGMAAWMVFGRAWRNHPVEARYGGVAIAGGIAGSVYLWTAHVAGSFGSPSENLGHLTGLGTWLGSNAFSMGELGTFLGYAAFPFLLVLGALASMPVRRARFDKAELVACCLMSAMIACQPLLAGPEITGPNAVRLCALGLAPLVIAAAIGSREARLEGPWRVPLAIGILGLASLHYNYTWIGPETKPGFAIFHLLAAVLVAVLLRVRRGT